MAALKKNYQDALREVRDHVRYGADKAKVARVIAIARQAGQAYSDRTIRTVDVEFDIHEHELRGHDLADDDRIKAA